MYYLCSENKGADQPRSSQKLICFFVFAYAKRLFSHDAAHTSMLAKYMFFTDSVGKHLTDSVAKHIAESVYRNIQLF